MQIACVDWILDLHGFNLANFPEFANKTNQVLFR